MAGTVKLCLGVVQCLNFSRTGHLANIEVLKQPVAPLVQRADHLGCPGGAAHCRRRLHLRLSQTRGHRGPGVLQLLRLPDLVGPACGTFRRERIILSLRVLLFHLDLLRLLCEVGNQRTNVRRDAAVPFMEFSSFEVRGSDTASTCSNCIDATAVPSRAA